MVDSDRKNVIVVLESKGDEDSDDNFEIGFSNENGKYSVLALIKKKLIAKSERVQNSLKDRDLVFKRQSDIKEGVWVVVSEDSPVKSGSIIKCTFKTSAKRSLHAATTDAAVMDPSSMPLVSNDEFIKELVVENVSTPVTIYDHSSQNVSTYDISHDNFFVLPQELVAENASSHSLRDASEGNCVLDNSETSTDIVDSSCDDHAQNIRSVAKNLKKRKLCLQSRNPPSKTTCLTTAVLKERREPTSVPLPANFNLPNRFRLDIQQKLDDSSSVFMAKDQSAFLREVANAIQLYSYKPSEFELANIVSEILLKYPHASSLPTAEAKHKDLIYKLKRIMERRRAELRIELSGKQKTKLRNDNHSDPTKCSQVAIDDTDETSYWKNVAKMFEIFEKGTVPYSDTVDALLKLTFSIRRALIMKWVPESGRMEKFMDKHCPFLKLQTFLFLEFELIMKKSCEIFRQKWTESAKLIVEAAKTTKKKQVAILLSSQRFQNMSPETYSRAALELLPFLVPGKGRGDKAARHLVDSRLESTNLQSCIMEERRGSPFILYIGSTIHLIMESNPFMRINTTADAVIGLMATYYVFHFKYSEKVQNALLFLQSYVFGENDKASDTCASVHSFSALLEKMKTSSF